MNDSYGIIARLNKDMIETAKFDLIKETKDRMAHQLLDAVIKEHGTDEITVRLSFDEYDIYENPFNPKTLNMTTYKEIKGKAKVIRYERL